MSEALDVCNAVADHITSITDPLVGSTYQLPADVDSNVWGTTRVVPSILVVVTRPMQQDLENRLAAGKVTITIEADVHDGPVTQYQNEGKRADLVSRSPVTLIASNVGGVWTLSGSVTAGNVIGVQSGPVGASYVALATDRLSDVVIGIASACTAVGIPNASSGNTIGLEASAIVKIASAATYVRAVARRLRKFGVFCWCANPWDRQLIVRNIEPSYRQGTKVPMPDGSTVRVVEFLGSSQEDPEGDGAIRDGLYLSRSQWLMDFTTTETFTRMPIVAADLTIDASQFANLNSQVLLAAQL